MQYPSTHRDETVDIIHGMNIHDPYRWLEDIDSPATRKWIEEQNKVTESFLSQCHSRQRITERLTELWDYEKYTPPIKRGGRYFFTYNNGLQNQSSLYWLESLDSEPQLLLDPNILSEDGTSSLSDFAVSKDGKRLAYSISSAGSDWQVWRVRDIDTGLDLPDTLQWVKFSSATWDADNHGFYYSRYEQPTPGEALKEANVNQKLYYHRIGDPQESDTIIYQRPDQPEWGFATEVTKDGRYLIIYVWKGTHRENAIFFKDLSEAVNNIHPLLPDFDAAYTLVFSQGSIFYFLTDHEAPNSRLVAIDINQPEQSHWDEIISETSDALSSIHRVGDLLIAIYLHDAHNQIKLFDLSGKPCGQIQLPGYGSVLGFHGDPEDQEAFYSYTSFTYPGTIFLFDLPTMQSTIFRQPELTFVPSDFEIQQIFYNSKDGTRIPMFLCHKPGIKLDGKNPTLLYGYGGFNIPVLPSFSVAALNWMEMGGIYAVANLRGGGEYGKTWHSSGMLHNKQNVFDDFIAAAEWLINQRYTSSPKLAIIGRSNGGLLTGACMTQRPDLFGACVSGVGVMDMLRFHKFTIGWAWISDYGSPDDPEDFKTLLAYSPYHNIRPGTGYPSTFIHTGDHDDRVFPAHSFKFASAMQNAQIDDAPVLIRIDMKAGHGIGKPTQKLISETADIWTFLVNVLKIEW